MMKKPLETCSVCGCPRTVHDLEGTGKCLHCTAYPGVGTECHEYMAAVDDDHAVFVNRDVLSIMGVLYLAAGVFLGGGFTSVFNDRALQGWVFLLIGSVLLVLLMGAVRRL